MNNSESNGVLDIKKVILLTSISLLSLQAIRSIMRFSSNYLEGYITQSIAKDMRVSFYNKVITVFRQIIQFGINKDYIEKKDNL